MIEVNSCVNKDGVPSVQLRWPEGRPGAQLAPDEARQHARILMEVAEAAEMDAIVFAWLKERMGLAVEQIAVLIGELREYRQGLAEAEAP
jgi:hypothetical protein